MKRFICFAVFFMIAWPPVAAAQEVVTLEGTFRQGGLVLGRTDPKAVVAFEGREVRVSSDGIFLIGFGRDAKPAATLKIRLPDGYEEVQQIDVGQREYDIQRIDGLPPKHVTPPPEVLEQLKEERRKTAAARRIDLRETWFLEEWIWPAEGRISGVYGSQRILNGQPRNPHSGVDVAAPEGTPIVAPAGGKVVLAEPDMFYNGNMVFIDHGHGLKTAYLHMSRIDVKVGQTVRRGEQIGAIGATGRVTGPHLHWMAYLFNTRLDPAFLVPERPGSRG